jgi:hypothetical protein
VDDESVAAIHRFLETRSSNKSERGTQGGFAPYRGGVDDESVAVLDGVRGLEVPVAEDRLERLPQATLQDWLNIMVYEFTRQELR